MNYQEVIQVVSKFLSTDTSQNLYLLFDNSQLKKKWRSNFVVDKGIPIWKNILKMEDETLSPVLFELDRQGFVCQIEKICKKILDSPVYSIIISPLSSKKLAEHLGQYSLCQTQDDQVLILRFFDTRILPILKKALSDEHRKYFFSPIIKWFYPDIVGEWHLIENQPVNNISKLKGILELTNVEYENILDETIPYTVFLEICEYLIQSEDISGNIKSKLWKDINNELGKEDISSSLFLINEFIERYSQSLPNKLEQWQSSFR